MSIPNSICILRLSAIGDVLHALPIVRTIQHVWPDTTITWVIGKLEYSLLGDIPGIEFIVFDKSKWFYYHKYHNRNQCQYRCFIEPAVPHM